MSDVRRETTRLLIAALGETRLRDLRAEGAAMDRTQAYTYTRTSIEDYLAEQPSDSTVR